MAANKTLDPSTCTSAPEAFKHPLPQVKQFHRSLTIELDEKNARLRTLVGGSYRQLLGTAEMILQMREDIQVVEDKLGRVGKGCGRGVVGNMATGLAKLQGADKGSRGEELEWTAKMKVLDMCGITVGRMLRRGGHNKGEQTGKGKNLVLAAKVLVLSRLLTKSLRDMAATRSADDKEMVEDMDKKLVSLRRRLRSAIKKTLQKVGEDSREELVQALSAYSLSNSSGARDTLWHFLHVRGEAMALSLDDDTENRDVIKVLELYTRTLLDVQALVPRRISEALAALKIKPLLKDESVRALEGLRLDVCDKWFGDEIVFFTPYIRHDDLEVSQAVDMLKGWAKKASEVMLQGLAKILGQMSEFKSVVDLRTRILEIWIKEGGKARGFDPSVLLDELREVINKRLVQLLESRVSKLHLVATEIEGTLGSWREGVTDRHDPLWDESMLEMDISNGASLFKQAILARTYGRNDAVSRVFKGYQTWRHLIEEIIAVIDQLKKQRWDDDLEDMEDDLSLESRNTLLSTEDPKMLQDHLDESLKKAYTDLHEKVGVLLSTYEDSEHIGQISIYILRIIRDIRSELPKNATLQPFGLALIPSLHERLASSISGNPLEAFTKAFSRKNRVAGRVLWEGEPELPVQPSPSTFKMLHSLTLGMTGAGGDLWSPTAVAVLKKHLRKELGTRWLDALKEAQSAQSSEINGTTEKEPTEVEPPKDESTNDEPTTTEGDTTTEATPKPSEEVIPTPDPKVQQDLLTQSLFDTLVLQAAFEIPDTTSNTEDSLKDLETQFESRILELEAAKKKRLVAAAKEYWKRTSLLFGLLA